MWSKDVVDLGDVFTIPHFLSDEMLSDTQRSDARNRLYGHDAPTNWPVSPLDICQSVLADAYARHPDLIPIVLGGDHSVGWPAFAAAFAHWEKTQGRRIGLLHFDAHTDLLADRLGVKYCFATWAWHANELLGEMGVSFKSGFEQVDEPRAIGSQHSAFVNIGHRKPWNWYRCPRRFNYRSVSTSGRGCPICQ